VSIVLPRRLLREAADELDERPYVPLEQVADDGVVVVVVTYAVDAVDVVPDRVTKRRRVNVLVSAHPAPADNHILSVSAPTDKYNLS